MIDSVNEALKSRNTLAAAVDHWAAALEHNGRIQSSSGDGYQPSGLMLRHKSGTLVGHARRVVADLRSDLWEIAAQKMSTSCKRSNAASSVAMSDVADSSLLHSAPNGKNWKSNQKINARTDPGSDVRPRRSFFWSSSSVMLHPLSCSGTASCPGSWGSDWSGTEKETEGIRPEGRGRRFATLQLGQSRLVLT